jgi:hypothetical protein
MRPRRKGWPWRFRPIVSLSLVLSGQGLDSLFTGSPEFGHLFGVQVFAGSLRQLLLHDFPSAVALFVS